ncbi:hypothetical protein [Arthrobacter sp. CJ23]|uniref:hypothetical protein n=1 Tax=Arthrobacter sp. CJ23 TaxID=2972479 RepID=UPI00215D5C87|nr:hypothetical protein [Arthrobacter sp. CJ23]UVJ39361.1 hypothetical protein NVV90_19545 [Arthrobacter sp. CJ23]
MRTPSLSAAAHGRRLAAVAALAGSLALAGCQATAPATPATPTSKGSTVNTSDFSTLDAAGVVEIRASRTARLDMSSGSLRKADVGVTAGSYGPEINTRDSGKITLTIVGPSGEITAETDRIRFNTTDKRTDFSEVTYFLTADSPEEFFGLIRDGVGRYGVDADSAERWIASAKGDPGFASDFSITPGTSTGLRVNYDLRYDGGKDTQVIIVHVLPAG